MSVKLPVPLDAMVAAINGGDSDAFLALFTEKGVVNDWGRRFVGAAAIRTWSDRELIGAKGRMTIGAAAKAGNVIDFAGDWKSDFFSGSGNYRLTLDGDKIAELRILES